MEDLLNQYTISLNNYFTLLKELSKSSILSEEEIAHCLQETLDTLVMTRDRLYSYLKTLPSLKEK